MRGIINSHGLTIAYCSITVGPLQSRSTVWAAASPKGIFRISLRAASERAFVAALRRQAAHARAGDPRLHAPAPAPALEGAQRDVQRMLAGIQKELAAYFSGGLRRFSSPVDLSGCTAFQRKVLDATDRIPFGRLSSYGEIAAEIGSPGAARAVGGALGSNPIPVRIPCHRVIAAGGRIGGFTGGLPIKRRLLRVEGVVL